MKSLRLNLEITFSEKVISDEDIKYVLDRVLSALIHEVDAGEGLSPENSDGHTEIIRVSEQFSNQRVIHNF